MAAALRFFVVRLLLCSLAGSVAGGCRARATTQPAPPKPAVRSASRSSREAVVVPDAVQLVRSYQGSIDGPNGTRQWLRLQITHAQPAATGIEFQYTLNVPDHREDKKGVLAPGGVIRFESFIGHARVEQNMVIVESEGIDGPPYFHLVGRPPSS